jgi:hypothetical protein
LPEDVVVTSRHMNARETDAAEKPQDHPQDKTVCEQREPAAARKRNPAIAMATVR